MLPRFDSAPRSTARCDDGENRQRPERPTDVFPAPGPYVGAVKTQRQREAATGGCYRFRPTTAVGSHRQSQPSPARGRPPYETAPLHGAAPAPSLPVLGLSPSHGSAPCGSHPHWRGSSLSRDRPPTRGQSPCEAVPFRGPLLLRASPPGVVPGGAILVQDVFCGAVPLCGPLSCRAVPVWGSPYRPFPRGAVPVRSGPRVRLSCVSRPGAGVSPLCRLSPCGPFLCGTVPVAWAVAAIAVGYLRVTM